MLQVTLNMLLGFWIAPSTPVCVCNLVFVISKGYVTKHKSINRKKTNFYQSQRPQQQCKIIHILKLHHRYSGSNLPDLTIEAAYFVTNQELSTNCMMKTKGKTNTLFVKEQLSVEISQWRPGTRDQTSKLEVEYRCLGKFFLRFISLL